MLGVDLSEDSVEKARERPSGAHAYFGSPVDVPEIAAGGFDVVTMWSVLAHLATPVEDLTMLRGLLADDGALLILTVNANSLLLKAHGPGWSGFTRNHLKIYSPVEPAAAAAPRRVRGGGHAADGQRPRGGRRVAADRPPGATAAAHGGRRQPRQMMRAVAFPQASGPARWGFDDAVAL